MGKYPAVPIRWRVTSATNPDVWVDIVGAGSTYFYVHGLGESVSLRAFETMEEAVTGCLDLVRLESERIAAADATLEAARAITRWKRGT